MRKAVLQSVRNLISRVLGVDRRHVEAITDLKNDLGADSLDKIEVAMELEEEFDIDIANSETLDMDTVNDAARIVERET